MKRVPETWEDLLSLSSQWKTYSYLWCEKLVRSKINRDTWFLFPLLLLFLSLSLSLSPTVISFSFDFSLFISLSLPSYCITLNLLTTLFSDLFLSSYLFFGHFLLDNFSPPHSLSLPLCPCLSQTLISSPLLLTSTPTFLQITPPFSYSFLLF